MSSNNSKINLQSFISDQKNYLAKKGRINQEELIDFSNALLSGEKFTNIPEKADEIWLKQLLEEHSSEAAEAFITTLNKANGNQPAKKEMEHEVTQAAERGRFAREEDHNNSQVTVKEQEFKSIPYANINANTQNATAQSAQDTANSEEKYPNKRTMEEAGLNQNLEKESPLAKRQKTGETKRLGDPEARVEAVAAKSVQEMVTKTMNNTEITVGSVKNNKRKFEELYQEDSELAMEPKKPRLDINIETGNTKKLTSRLEQLAKDSQDNKNQGIGRY